MYKIMLLQHDMLHHCLRAHTVRPSSPALLLRRGDITHGTTVDAQHLSLSLLWAAHLNDSIRYINDTTRGGRKPSCRKAGS